MTRVLHVLDHSLPMHSGYTFRTRAILKAQQASGIEVRGITGLRHTEQGPAVEIAIDSGHEALTESIHEVVLTCTVTTKIGADKIVFLVEAKQAGIFDIRNIPAEQMPIVVNVVSAADYTKWVDGKKKEMASMQDDPTKTFTVAELSSRGMM